MVGATRNKVAGGIHSFRGLQRVGRSLNTVGSCLVRRDVGPVLLEWTLWLGTDGAEDLAWPSRGGEWLT